MSLRVPRRGGRSRPLIAFFGYNDVFEDFYPHYGVSQQAFAGQWMGSGNHRFLKLLQDTIGDVVWYELSIAPELKETLHQHVGCRIRMMPSSWLHRQLWRVFYLSKSSWRWQRFYKIYAIISSYLSLLSWPLLRSLFLERPEVLFVQDYATGRFDVLLVLSRLLRVPLVAYHAGSTPEYYLGKFIKRFSIPRVNWLITSSRRELEMLAKDFNVPRAHLRIVLTPVDLDNFRPMNRYEACQIVGLDSSVRYLLFIGRLVDRIKRVSMLIEAFAQIAHRYPRSMLLIAGDGPDSQALRALTRRLCPDRVRFLGWINESAKLRCLYNVVDCLCLPSRSEGFPNVVGEAMACGTPVVGSDVGGVGELVAPGRTGWLIPPENDTALVQALDDVLAHPADLSAMRVRARSIAEKRVSTRVIVEQLRECFGLIE